jgi:hypothetical protein
MRFDQLFSEEEFLRIRELAPMATTMAPQPTGATTLAPNQPVQQDPQAMAKMAAQQAKDRMDQKKQIQDQIKQTEQQLQDLKKKLAELG